MMQPECERFIVDSGTPARSAKSSPITVIDYIIYMSGNCESVVHISRIIQKAHSPEGMLSYASQRSQVSECIMVFPTSRLSPAILFHTIASVSDPLSVIRLSHTTSYLCL